MIGMHSNCMGGDCEPSKKEMVDVCTAILRPHNVLCRATTEMLLLLVKHAPTVSLCQNKLACSIEHHGNSTSTANITLSDVERTAIKIFYGYGNPNGQRKMRVNNGRGSRDLEQFIETHGIRADSSEFAEHLDKNDLLEISRRFVDAVEYYHANMLIS
ncbi:hypothetical protein DICVIV_09885 [Dictyocaulus viviparus]|uniref:Uncharacterized protein n=1 Tax=Dictyocaulus viviparus TaxID=29172 RepID=A0A0D8XHF3_DICVI|nr:hypothetical protein DICVIV_09885 [Dictyocaulus viviparus]